MDAALTDEKVQKERVPLGSTLFQANSDQKADLKMCPSLHPPGTGTT